MPELARRAVEVHLISSSSQRLPEDGRGVLTAPSFGECLHRQLQLIVVEELSVGRRFSTGQKLNPGSVQMPPGPLPTCSQVIARHGCQR